jgi:hypothetical protein
MPIRRRHHPWVEAVKGRLSKVLEWVAEFFSNLPT